MERSKSFDERLSRILKAANISKHSELSKLLGINQSSIAAARKRGQLPPGWIEKIAEDFNINANWLFFGQGSMRTGEPVQPQEKTEEIPSQIPSCPRCAKLEEKLERVEAQRDELAQENRQLLHKISDLRVENAIQKEQLRVASGKSVVADIA